MCVCVCVCVWFRIGRARGRERRRHLAFAAAAVTHLRRHRQDAAGRIVAARHAGIEVSKSQVYKDLEEEAGEANGQELQVAVAVMYAREKVSPFSCSMTCMHGLTHS